MKSNLILGFGSELLSDESIVTKIINNLEADFVPVTDFKTAPTGSLDLIHDITGYSRLIVLDTIHSTDKEPGVVTHFTFDNYKPTEHLENYHDVSFKDILELGRLLHIEIPGEIHFITIQITSDKTIDEELSKELFERYPGILKKVKSIISDCLMPRK